MARTYGKLNFSNMALCTLFLALALSLALPLSRSLSRSVLPVRWAGSSISEPGALHYVTNYFGKVLVYSLFKYAKRAQFA